MNNKIKKFINQILDIIFPIQCLGCRQEGRWVCKSCASKINITQESACLFCHQKTLHGEICQACCVKYSLTGILIAASYEQELVKKAIKTLKYRFVKDIAQELSRLLILFLWEKIKPVKFLKEIGIKNIPDIFLNFEDTVIIPVPLHSRRERWRGFNQAKALALPVAEEFSLPINTTDLRRVRYTSSQAQLSANDRRSNLKDSFIWQGESLVNKNIILIDDVATTGSTLEECAKILKKHQAGEVWGLVVAKN